MSSPEIAPARSRRGIVVGVVLFLLLLVVVTGRWFSSNLVAGSTVEDRVCDDTTGWCVEHVTRADWLILAPYDEWHVMTKTNSGRYYSADNPFDEYSDITYDLSNGVSITDGTVTLTWPKPVLDRLGD
ncbi:hypothetical protein [Catenuloplanes japonicus]|uniref:hypothetical protein n=1 Tax=Catenuloplanes japonicus TaxID=33876 RepID=UPI000524E981|nr:hypothetical protein [Catenuloplanes japonicus]